MRQWGTIGRRSCLEATEQRCGRVRLGSVGVRRTDHRIKWGTKINNDIGGYNNGMRMGETMAGVQEEGLEESDEKL